jgi:hypothetical protein
MAKLYSLLLVLLCASISLCYAQQPEERIISGILRDPEDNPLPGANIIVKGTQTGVMTDINGFYSLKVPLGATLVVSFIGFTTYEIKVTARNSRSAHAVPRHTPPVAKLPLKKQYAIADTMQGVARMGANTPTYILKSTGGRVTNLSHINRMYASPGNRQVFNINYLTPKLATLRYGAIGKNGLYVIDDKTNWSSPLVITIGTAWTVEHINKLPELQNSYAQGKPVEGTAIWRGPETGEVFSWGPPISELKSSTGEPAQAYNPYGFFRTGIRSEQQVSLQKQFNNAYVQAGYQRTDQQTVIPGAGLYRNNLNVKLKARPGYNLDTDASLYLSETNSRLAQRGANLASIMSAVMRTPPTFDNSNGIAGNRAMHTSAAYLLANGSPRTYSPGHSDNPYGLSSQLPDREELKSLLSTFNIRYTNYNFVMHTGLGIDKQWNTSRFGLPALAAGAVDGRYTERNLGYSSVNYRLGAGHTLWLNNFGLTTSLDYNLTYLQQSLSRADGFGFSPGSTFAMARADSSTHLIASPDRYMHEVSALVKASFMGFVEASLSNRTYHSSTLPEGNVFLPGANIGFLLTRLEPLRHSNVLSFAKLFATYAQTQREAPLLYNHWQYNSTALPAASYLLYTENQELVHQVGLLPELHQKQEYGTELKFFRNLGLDFAYYSNLTQNAVLPLPAATGFVLANSATVQTRGIDATLHYSNAHYYMPRNALKWKSALTFSTYRPVVKEVYGPNERIATAGFSDISTNLVAGAPYGMLYGTAYKRNHEGQKVIGADGYPLVDDELKPLGNPNPDWLGSLYNKFDYRDAWFAFTVDVRKGGAIWNGTSNVLNYYGTSRQSEAYRNTRNYVFEGVLEGGSVNTTPVDFANPANGLEGNRWVRYGTTGIAEDAIEDGSWIRLNNISLGYKLNSLTSRLPRSETHISLTATNLFLITPYSGVDPASTLFGYAAGTGLDLFNTPNTRSYTISINIKL